MKKAVNFVKYHLATGFGVGRSPYAPGTMGSLLGVLLVYFLLPQHFGLQFLLLAVVFVVAVVTSQWLAEAEGAKDPSVVVIDEIAGQLVTFLWVPFAALGSFKVLLAGFLIFRAFDIWKPWPIRKAENLPGGWGIVLDDVLAGIYANIILQVWLRWIM